ncbi:MAG: hypothetical protein K9W44_03980 [Candidatus Lokiarchaeota archaeon]|nr:hypothetical protein [Candidatus Harpocratesius repetitus]
MDIIPKIFALSALIIAMPLFWPVLLFLYKYGDEIIIATLLGPNPEKP